VVAASSKTAARRRFTACRRPRCRRPEQTACRRCRRSRASSRTWWRRFAMFRDGAERLLVFRVGEERFGVALSAVREVIDSPAVSRVPDAAPSLLGVAMVRDELVPVYDSRALLEVGQTGGSPGAALLFSVDDRRVALAIDDVFDPILVEERELRPMPGAGAKDTNIRGLVRRDGDLVAVLDEGALLDTMLATASGTGGAGGDAI